MTSLSFLIDTDWVIDHFNSVAQVTRRLKELEPHGLGLSVITAAELWEGVYFSRDPKRSQVMLEEFLSGVVVLGLDEEICKRFGQLRGFLRKTWTDHRRFRSPIAPSALRYDLTGS
jgi:tRNA(fMet)-specific endonuclease VapC